MHKSAMLTGKLFFDHYGTTAESVLEVGSFNVNGSLREVAPSAARYWGVDQTSGLDVDEVLVDSHKLPFADGSYDIVVSSSTLEHDPMFWVTFLEMTRVARRYVYLSAPVQGPVHNHPIDCWRFYPDAGKALAEWARSHNHHVHLVESFLVPPTDDIWCDFVGIFGKAEPGRRLSQLPSPIHSALGRPTVEFRTDIVVLN